MAPIYLMGFNFFVKNMGSAAPAFALEFGCTVFGGVGAGVPESCVRKSVGEELLAHEIAGVVVGVFVVGSVTHLFHQ